MNSDFTKVSNKLIRDSTLSPLEKIVFIYILSRSGGKGTCFPGYKLMAEECNVSVNTVRKATRMLQILGLIKIEKRCDEIGGNTSNLFVPDENYTELFM